MAVTLKDIAKRVNKSVTTVSRALADYDDVSPETREQVRKVAAEMGYSPSSFAQRLQKQRSETIGLVLPTYGPRFSDPFFSEFLAGVGNQAAAMDYDLLVSTRPPGEEELQAYRTAIQGRRVDGFVVVRTRCRDARIKYLCDRGFPFVAFGRVEGECEFPFVDRVGGELTEAYRQARAQTEAWSAAGLQVVGVTPTPFVGRYVPGADGTLGLITPSQLPDWFGEPGSDKYVRTYEALCEWLADDLRDYVRVWQIANELDIGLFSGPLSARQGCELIIAGARGLKGGSASHGSRHRECRRGKGLRRGCEFGGVSHVAPCSAQA